MKVAYVLVAILMIFALVSTVVIGGKGDEGYANSAKQNTMRLSFIYLLLVIILLGGIALYVIAI
ncbi:hypothetical protein [Ectobacillus panaciterrae]|uniref:hypothetical protein n=1 Tax=Ectobacillus panaciterrae TaxID=363872 RepID=UPI00042969C8|nr:hypothetical protein [Ectobacillus panaciterrae]